MNRPNRKPLHSPASLAATGRQGLGAKDGQATSDCKPMAHSALAQCLLIQTCLISAQRMFARMATYADWAPAGLVETADLIDQASDLIAAIIANGGAQ